MSAAVGQRYYYQDDDDYKKIAGGLREKYGVNNLFDAYYNPKHAIIPSISPFLYSMKPE